MVPVALHQIAKVMGITPYESPYLHCPTHRSRKSGCCVSRPKRHTRQGIWDTSWYAMSCVCLEANAHDQKAKRSVCCVCVYVLLVW